MAAAPGLGLPWAEGLAWSACSLPCPRRHCDLGTLTLGLCRPLGLGARPGLRPHRMPFAEVDLCVLRLLQGLSSVSESVCPGCTRALRLRPFVNKILTAPPGAGGGSTCVLISSSSCPTGEPPPLGGGGLSLVCPSVRPSAQARLQDRLSGTARLSLKRRYFVVSFILQSQLQYHTCAHAHTRTHARACTQARAHRDTWAHMHVHAHTGTHTCTHTRTCTHRGCCWKAPPARAVASDPAGEWGVHRALSAQRMEAPVPAEPTGLAVFSVESAPLAP